MLRQRGRHRQRELRTKDNPIGKGSKHGPLVRILFENETRKAKKLVKVWSLLK